MTRATHVLAVTALAFVAAPARPPAVPPVYDFSRPRDLPSMVTRWESKGPSCAVVVHEGAAYILRKDGLEARAAHDGRLLWAAKVPPGDCPYHWQEPLRILDRRLLAGFRDRLFVVDRASGAVERTIPLEGFLTHLSGPPVAVVVGHQNGPYDLLSLDIDTGSVTARRALPGYPSDLVSAHGTILAVWREESLSAAHGLSPKDLSEVWSSTVYSGIRDDDGTVYGTATDEDCGCDQRFSVLDAASGMPFERWPRREPDGNSSTAGARLPWDLQLVGPEHPYFDLRRNRREDGRPLWTSELPGAMGAWARHGDSFFTHVDPQGRGFLLELDWNTGTILRAAYGLRTVYELAAAGDVIVLHAEDTVLGVSARELGPAEATLHPVADEVRRILSGRIDYWELGTPARELQVLGPEALPVLADLIPSLDPLPLRVAASVAAQAGYHPAAPRLAARLSSLAEAQAVQAVLDALAKIGGPGEVAAIAARLDRQQPSFIRFAAFMTLANLATPEAIAALEAARPKPAAHAAWWEPPSPEALLPLLGKPVDPQDIQRKREAGAWAEVSSLLRARDSARGPAPGGRSVVVFPDSGLGRVGDLWMAELDGTGALRGPAIFLGVKAPGPQRSEGMPITVRLDGAILEIRRADGAHGVAEVDVAAAARDTDKDGIPDLVEGRLSLDPRRADTDRDGLSDSVDPVPNAATSASGEDAEVAAAFFEQYFGIDVAGESRHAVIVVSDRVLPRYGRRGPTFVLTAKEAARLAKAAERDEVSLPTRLTLEPAGSRSAGPAMPLAAYTTTGGRPDRARAEERALVFTTYSGPLSAAGYAVVMRKIGERWYVRSFVQTWVS